MLYARHPILFVVSAVRGRSSPKSACEACGRAFSSLPAMRSISPGGPGSRRSPRLHGNELFGRRMASRKSLPARYSRSAILFNLALLATFKYLPEVSVPLPFSSLQRFSHLALPLGISFWTFQAMSYLFDLYRGEELDPSFLEFALYMAFFPVTISGPICRLPEMLPQFRSEAPLPGTTSRRDYRIATGVLMMQLAKLLGQGILGGDGIDFRLRSRHALERRGRLVPGFRIRSAAFLRFCRLLAHRHRRGSGARIHGAGKLRPPFSIHQPFDLLDALAHVALFLDSRLCFSAAGHVAP